MPSQRPFFLSSVFAAFRQQEIPLAQQPNKHHTTSSSSTAASAANRNTSATAAAAAAAAAAAQATSSSSPSTSSPSATSGARPISSSTATTPSGVPSSSTTPPPRSANIPIQYPSHRRGSDSSSEGFRDVIGADKWYIGGRTAGGEERFFKLGVVRRVRSNDGLSLDRLSL